MASNPFGITQVDAPGLLQMYTGLQRQSLEDQYRRAAFEHTQKLDQRADSEYTRQEHARDLIAHGAKPADVIAADPATGFQYASHAAAIDKDQREQQAERAHAVGNAAIVVSRLPAAEQPAAWDQSIDQLVRQGYTDLAPYKGHYDPKALPALIAASAEASTAYLGQSDKDRAYQETVRNHKATEATAAANAGTEAAGLRIRQHAEDRVTKWGPQPLFGTVGSLNPNADPTGSDLDAKYRK